MADRGAPVGVAVMLKQFTGGGLSVAQRDHLHRSLRPGPPVPGTYVAMESFDGALDGAVGTFNFVHAATTEGGDGAHEHFAVVPGSGTGRLAGHPGRRTH